MSATTHAAQQRLNRWSGALICLLILGQPVAYGQVSGTEAKPFIMAVDGDPSTYGSRWVSLIYRDVFQRLGIPLQIEHYTLARREALVEEGATDGETSRIYAYGNTRPYLVRVEESLIDLSFALFAANPAVHLEKIEQLRETNYHVEYRRGILLCETMLKQLVPAERLSDIPTHQQGLKKLLAGRTDLYCDLEPYVRQGLDTPEFKDVATTVRKVVAVGNAVPTYPYLHKRHAALAPRMAEVLRKMKAEGLIERYRLQVERDLGWSR